MFTLLSGLTSKTSSFANNFLEVSSRLTYLLVLDFYYSFVTRDIVKGGPKEPVAVRTSLGWVFCGPTSDGSQECSVSMNVQVCNEEQLNDMLKKFFDLESIGIKPV